MGQAERVELAFFANSVVFFNKRKPRFTWAFFVLQRKVDIDVFKRLCPMPAVV